LTSVDIAAAGPWVGARRPLRSLSRVLMSAQPGSPPPLRVYLLRRTRSAGVFLPSAGPKLSTESMTCVTALPISCASPRAVRRSGASPRRAGGGLAPPPAGRFVDEHMGAPEGGDGQVHGLDDANQGVVPRYGAAGLGVVAPPRGDSPATQDRRRRLSLPLRPYNSRS
jgi:hypothetical protein